MKMKKNNRKISTHGSNFQIDSLSIELIIYRYREDKKEY